MKKSPLEFYKSKSSGRWYWRITSKRGKKLARSSGGKGSGYATKSAAIEGYRDTKKLMDLIKV